MMMCIGSVSDFEAQLTVSAEQLAWPGTAEERERRLRGTDWLYDRRADNGWSIFQPPVDPSLPYSHGRRFVPAWLSADREISMAFWTWTQQDVAVHLEHGQSLQKDPSILSRPIRGRS